MLGKSTTTNKLDKTKPDYNDVSSEVMEPEVGVASFTRHWTLVMAERASVMYVLLIPGALIE